MNFEIGVPTKMCLNNFFEIVYLLIAFVMETIWLVICAVLLQLITMGQAVYGLCVPRKGLILALLGMSVIFTFGVTILHNSSARMFHPTKSDKNMADLQSRLMEQYGEKEEDLSIIQEKLHPQRNDSSHKSSEDEMLSSTYSPTLEELLRNLSGSRASEALSTSEKPELINAPFSLKIVPHLLNDPDSLRPAYQMGNPRRFADYIIGVPHVKRDKENYLFGTLQHLLNGMKAGDRNSTLIVVMVGETDLKYVVKTAHEIEKMFPQDVADGVIEIISPRESYYPEFNELTLTLGDSAKRVKWRTKQNLDTLFVMAYSQPRCLYYIMIEDDVLATDGYMKEIREFNALVTVSNPDWFFTQYSTTGGIGKLFRSSNLVHFMTYVQLFYSNMPIDWLTESYLADRKCGINKSAVACAAAKTSIRPTYKKNLFKHVGQYSSLKGKYQKVKNPVKPAPKFYPHVNPTIHKIKCDLETYERYTIEGAYFGETFFWGKPPKKNNVIEFWFERPRAIDRYMIRSGNVDRPNDIIHNGTLEIFTSSTNAFTPIADFDEFGIVEGNVNKPYDDPISAIRIRFNETSSTWVMISEIQFDALDKKKVS